MSKVAPLRRQVVIYGIETHICVLQTCLDLIKHGYSVWVIIDGTSSRKSLDREVGI